LTEPTQIGTTIVAIAATLGALAICWRYVRRGWRAWRAARTKATAVMDAILGRDAILDSITGEEIAPALPGMGVRLAQQEQQMELITAAVTSLASQKDALNDHERRIKALEDAALERVAAKTEATAAWRAVEAVANGDGGQK